MALQTEDQVFGLRLDWMTTTRYREVVVPLSGNRWWSFVMRRLIKVFFVHLDDRMESTIWRVASDFLSGTQLSLRLELNPTTHPVLAASLAVLGLKCMLCISRRHSRAQNPEPIPRKFHTDGNRPVHRRAGDSTNSSLRDC